jgi:hypothetical protein
MMDTNTIRIKNIIDTNLKKNIFIELQNYFSMEKVDIASVNAACLHVDIIQVI